MYKLLGIVLVFAASCAKDMKYDNRPLGSGYRIDLDMIGSDSGTTWRVDQVQLHVAKLLPPGDKNLPDYKTTDLTFSEQRFYCKSRGLSYGSYLLSDTMANLLHLPASGEFIIDQKRETSSITLEIKDRASKPWLSFKRFNAGGILFGNLIEGWRSYQVNDSDYHVQFTLMPL